METLQRTANRGSVSTGYDVANSLKVESDNNEYLERSTSGASDGSSTQHTISVWVKRTELGVDSEPVSAGGIGRFRFESNDTFSYQFRSGKELITTQVFRDTSSWYHIVAAADSSQSTASNRMKVYVNGVQVTDFGTANYQDQNQGSPAWGKNTIYSLRVGAAASSTRNFNGYIAEMYYIDGQTLDPTSFGEFDDNGIWIPKAFSGTHGSLDTYLDFSDASNLGKNSGGTTDLTANNISAADQATDTCTNNFCVINAINLSTQTLTQGATKIVSTDNSSRTSFGTMAVSKGKWWWEGKIQVYESNTTYPCIGVTGDLDNPPATSAQLFGSNHVIKLAKNQKWVTNDTGTSYGTTYSDNDIINIGLDMDNHIMYTYKNGTIDDASGINFSSQSAATSDDFYIPINLVYVTGGGSSWEMNFGGFANYTISSAVSDANGYGTFEYAPPSGYYALCTKNLAEYG